MMPRVRGSRTDVGRQWWSGPFNSVEIQLSIIGMFRSYFSAVIRKGVWGLNVSLFGVRCGVELNGLRYQTFKCRGF